MILKHNIVCCLIKHHFKRNMFIGVGYAVMLDLPPDDGELPVWGIACGFIIHGTGGVNGPGRGVGCDPVVP